MAGAFASHAFQALNLYTAAFQAVAEERVSADAGTSESGLAFSIQGVGGTNEAVGQSFTTGAAFTATGLAVKLHKNLTPADNLILELVDNNITSGTVLATATIAAASVPAAAAFAGYVFASSASLSASTQYFIRATRSGARDTANYYRISTWATGSYAGGEAWQKASGSWASTARDARMMVFGDPIAAAAEPPILVMAPR
jgi:hypothetical protein